MNTAEAVRYLETKGLAVPRFQDVDRFLSTDVPFPVPGLVSEELGAEASLSLWDAARRHSRATGLVPVLLGAEPMVDWVAEPTWSRLRTRITGHLEAASRPTGPAVAAMEARLRERFSPQVVDRLRARIDQLRPAWLVAPGSLPCGVDTSCEALQGGFLNEPEPVRCVLLRCPPHHVPLYLGLGGWNGSPAPHEQAALLGRWSRRYGTRLVHVGRSAVELWTPRPPARIEEVRRLGWEVLLYCHDAVFQDADPNLPHLRQMLAGSWWRFWWD